MWWYTPLILALGRQKPIDFCESGANQGYIVKPWFTKKKERNTMSKCLPAKTSHMDNAVFLSQANTNAENPKLISAVLCAALYPNVVQVTVHFS